MARPRTAFPGGSGPSDPHSLSGIETARYTKDMLDGLMSIARAQGQDVLASLLEAASGEAERLGRGAN